MKGLNRTLALLLTFVLLCGLLPVRAHAAATSVSGTIYASNLADNAELKLTGDTTLVVDTNKALKSISGDYALTIQGSNTTLTIKNSSGHGISVSSFTTDLSACSLVIGSKKDGLNIDKDIVLKGGMVSIDAEKDGIYSRNGSITVNGGIVDASCGTNCAAIKAMTGDIQINAGTVDASGAKEAITTEAGSIQLNGNVTALASGWAIWAKKDVKVNGGTTKARAGCAIYAGGGFAMKAKVTAESTIDGAPAISARESITVNGGTLTAECSSNAAALKSYTGSILVNAGDVTALGAKEGLTAEEGSILIYGNVTARASGWAIWAKNEITIHGGTTKARAGCAIYAGDAITINADVEAEAFMNGAPAISARNNITMNGGTIKAECSTNGSAIVSANGNITVNAGDVKASGAKKGISAEKGSVTLAGNVTASASGWAVWGETGIVVPAPYKILVPTNGTIIGKQIANQNGNPAAVAHISIPPLSGTITNSGLTPAPGTQLSYSLAGMVAGVPESKLSFQWQESSSGEGGWTDKSGATSKYYVVQTADVGKYLRVRITAGGYQGVLYSSPWHCVKWPCQTGVVSPILEISNNQVRVTNPQSNQEYILLTTKKQSSALTESDWASSKTWSSGIFYLGGTTNTVNYVYTRVKEDSGHYAGKTVGWQSIYLGATTSVQDIAIRPELMVASGSSWTTQELETDEHGFYYTKLQDVIKITATPTPSNATFNGILGSKWLVKGYSRTSQYGKYYTTPECTTVISADQSYKVVYFRPENTMINGMELRAEYTRGYNDVVTDAFSINVGNKLGVYNLDSVQFPTVTINVGDTLTGLTAEPHPDKAALSGMSATLNSGTGTAPVISFAESTFSVDASNATGGSYYFYVSKSGSQVGGITVKVIAPPVEELRLVPSELTGEAGFSYELAPQFSPANSETQATWTSSNTAAATVADGVVTIPANADIGATATITATAGGKSATCLVTVAGELYDLKLDGVQVSSRNMDDVLGNGVFAFDGFQTLTVRGSYSSSKRVIDNDIDGLIINVESDATLTSTDSAAISTSADATITGSGKLTLKSNTDCGFYLSNREATLTILDAALAVNGKWGLAGPNGASSAKLVIDHAAVTAKATDGAICDFGGGITILNSEIVKPAGGKISSDGKDLVDASGTISNDVQIDALLILPVVRFTMDSEPVVGGRLTVDIDKMAEWDETLMEAYLDDAVSYQWYRNGKAIPGADKESLKLTYTEKDTEVYVVVSYGEYRLESEHMNVLFLSNPFTDVTEGKYFFNPVMWAYYHDPQITAGTSKTTFSPNDTCTRAQIVTFLWRAAGSPEPTTTNNPFKDVTSDKYYYRAVLWAAENGITSGTAADKFSPNDGCTRAQVVTFLWRFAGSPEPTSTSNPFTDVPSGKYYTKAVLWAAKKGVTAGTSATTFSPDDTCTRGQIVTFLYRYMEG